MKSQKKNNKKTKKIKKTFRTQKFQNSINVSARQCQCQTMSRSDNVRIYLMSESVNVRVS